MQNILKKFPTETDETEKHDFVQQKYVTSTPKIVDIPKPTKIPKKRIPIPTLDYSQKTNAGFSPKKYLFQIPTLLLGLVSYLVTYMMLKNVQPAAIQNVLFNNSYLPLLVSSGLGHFFSSWYLFQNGRRATLLALLLSLLLFFRIQHIWSNPIIFAAVLPFFGLELLLTYKSFRR